MVCVCKNIARDKTYFKNPIILTCIVLITTNRPKSFQKPEVIETALSAFHKKNEATMVVLYSKQKSKVNQQRKHKDFFNDAFKHELESTFSFFFLKFRLKYFKLLSSRYFKTCPL